MLGKVVFTHEQRSYKARCVQYTGNNLEEVRELIPNIESVQGGKSLLMRFNGTIQALYLGDWVVQQENGIVKHYREDIHPIKYRRLCE